MTHGARSCIELETHPCKRHPKCGTQSRGIDIWKWNVEVNFPFQNTRKCTKISHYRIIRMELHYITNNPLALNIKCSQFQKSSHHNFGWSLQWTIITSVRYRNIVEQVELRSCSLFDSNRSSKFALFPIDLKWKGLISFVECWHSTSEIQED